MGAEKVDLELSEFFNKLWRLDDQNRCKNGVHYQINKQGWAKFQGDKDNARAPLFTWLDVGKVSAIPTFQAFYHLLDNYVAQTGEQEVVTGAEVQENRRFIDAIMATPVMQEAHKFLVDHRKAPKDNMQFKKKLYTIWFDLYRRTKGDRDFDSSAFEHVFVGEIKDTRDGEDDQVTGFHNWLQIYLQEKKGVLDYMGYYGRGTDEDDSDPRLITVKFRLRQDDEPNEEDLATKPKGSSFLGTTPEFEMALYSVAYLMDRGDILIELEGALTGPINYYRSAFRHASNHPTTCKVKVPTLLIWGTDDMALGEEMAAMSADFCDDIRIKKIAGGNHFIQQDKTEEVNAFMEEFLQEKC